MEERDRQRIARERKAHRMKAMTEALLAVLAKIDGRDTPLANELREIATKGLSA